jgi:hypothetical protein
MHHYQGKQSKLNSIEGSKSMNRSFSNGKMPSLNLLAKKPEIFLMKWNDCIQKYHILVQLYTVTIS